jgi:hypothetical protein
MEQKLIVHLLVDRRRQWRLQPDGVVASAIERVLVEAVAREQREGVLRIDVDLGDSTRRPALRDRRPQVRPTLH